MVLHYKSPKLLHFILVRIWSFCCLVSCFTLKSPSIGVLCFPALFVLVIVCPVPDCLHLCPITRVQSPVSNHLHLCPILFRLCIVDLLFCAIPRFKKNKVSVVTDLCPRPFDLPITHASLPVSAAPVLCPVYPLPATLLHTATCGRPEICPTLKHIIQTLLLLQFLCNVVVFGSRLPVDPNTEEKT